jgi:hypothetical protein
MGRMRFLVPQPERLPPEAARRAFVVGPEGIPWESHATLHGGELAVDRPVRDSGALNVSWPVDGHGAPFISTTCLMEREEPYHLPVELARGTLNRIRNQLAQWTAAGLSVGDDTTRALSVATDAFSRAATRQESPVDSARAAQESLRASLDLIDRLASEYTRQALVVRHRQFPKLGTLLAANLENLDPPADADRWLASAFSAAAVPLVWRNIEPAHGQFDWTLSERQIQFCRQAGMKIIAGPLLRLDKRHLPDWVYLYEEDFETLRGQMLAHVQAVAERYRGNVLVWHCAAGINVPDALNFDEEEKLRLVVYAVETLRQVDPRTAIVVSFDQPWGEYMAGSDADLAPLQFADALARAEIGLSGLGLEINFGCWPGGTEARDLLEISRQIDRWSLLGLPLVVTLTIPSGPLPDPLAQLPIEGVAQALGQEASSASQQELARQIVSLLLAKAPVQAVVWNQMQDAQPHAFPHGGLFDSAGRAKPILQTLAQLRGEHVA